VQHSITAKQPIVTPSTAHRESERTPVFRRAAGGSPFGRSARNWRIVERLREGFGYDEIARERKLSERRLHQIVKQALERREALEGAVHAHMQIDRLGRRCGSRGMQPPRQPMGDVGELMRRGNLASPALNCSKSLINLRSWLKFREVF
jgi:hypothetical protein